MFTVLKRCLLLAALLPAVPRLAAQDVAPLVSQPLFGQTPTAAPRLAAQEGAPLISQPHFSEMPLSAPPPPDVPHLTGPRLEPTALWNDRPDQYYMDALETDRDAFTPSPRV